MDSYLKKINWTGSTGSSGYSGLRSKGLLAAGEKIFTPLNHCPGSVKLFETINYCSGSLPISAETHLTGAVNPVNLPARAILSSGSAGE